MLKQIMIPFTFLLVFNIAKADTFSTISDPDSTCYVWLDTLPDFCFEAISEGNAPFTYVWSNGTFQNTTCVDGLTGSEVCVTITDATGCYAYSCYTIPPPCDANIYLAGNPTTGHFLQASASGISTFTYNWNNGETTSDLYPNATGNFCVTVTDATGCSSEDCFYHQVNDSCSVVLELSQNGECVHANVTSGSGTFIYEWGNGMTTPSICGAIGDTICVTVTDSLGCVSNACILLENDSIICNLIVNVNINDMLGAPLPLLEAITSSTDSLYYLWSTGETSPNITPMNGSGNYCVSVVDGNGCSASSCVTVNLNNCSLELETVQGGNCLQALPIGTAPFTYTWSDGSTTNSFCSNSSTVDSVCVVVTDSIGCIMTACGSIGNSPDSCSVQIELDTTNGVTLTALSTGEAPFSYDWSNSANTNNITVTTSGEYQLTLTDASGCTSIVTQTLYCNSSGGGFIDYDTIATGTITYTSHISLGYGNYSYQWSTGETTQSITAPSDAYYFVTVTDALGCEYILNTYNCFAGISSSGDELTATPYGQAPFTYEWSTSENTPSISVSSGTYCITIVDAGGCVSYDCITHFSSNDILGYVGLDSLDQPVGSDDEVRVYLIQHDSVAGTLTAIDSVDVVASSSTSQWGNFLPFSFTNLTAGNYLLKAAMVQGAESYANFLPTYYQDVLFWNEATSLTIPMSMVGNDVYLTMVPGNNPGGPGFIGGLVSEGANLTTTQADTRGEGDPLSNVNVLLLTDNDEPVSHTVTDANGKFQFPELAYGTYKVVVEILGKDSGEKMVTIGTDVPTADVEFSVNETFVTSFENVLNGASLKVFPNPVEDNFYLQLETKEEVILNVNVINLLGEVVVSENKNMTEGLNTLSINIKEFPAGIYFLNLTDGIEILSKRVIKN